MSGQSKDRNMVSPSSLPYYEDTSKSSYTLIKQEPTSLQIMIKTARETVAEVCSTVSGVIDTGKAHTQGALAELREDENIGARVGLIGGATVVGLVVGSLRGRRVSRVLYSLVGGGAGAVVCYPSLGQGVGEVSKEGVKVVSGGKMESLSLSLPVVDPVIVLDTMKSSLQTLLSKCQELYKMAVDAVQSDAEQPRSSLVAGGSNSQDVAALTPGDGKESSTSKKAAAVVFLPPSSLVTPDPVEGDPGMGSDEDRDLYTTRG